MTRNFTIIDAPQRSPEWFAARLGRVTGSKAVCVMMGEKTAGRADYMLQLALERITGTPEEAGYVSAEMQRGVDKEPLARMRAEADGEFIRETGFISHNTLMIGASLDGDSDDFARIWEFKAPKSTTHVKYLRSDGGLLLQEYQYQVTHNLYVCGAQHAVIGSFDDRMPIGLEWVQRAATAADLPLAEYEKALLKFLAELDALTAELTTMQLARAPAPQPKIEEPMNTMKEVIAELTQDALDPDFDEVQPAPAPSEMLASAPVEAAFIDAVTTGTGIMRVDADGKVAAIPPADIFLPAPPSLRLGQITERLGFVVTADFMLTLGFAPAATDKAAKLYHESSFPSMCNALLRHISNIRDHHSKATV